MLLFFNSVKKTKFLMKSYKREVICLITYVDSNLYKTSMITKFSQINA